jgi:hypothetical protein
MNEFCCFKIDTEEEPEEKKRGDQNEGEELKDKSKNPIEKLDKQMEDGVMRGEVDEQREATGIDRRIPDMVTLMRVSEVADERLLNRRYMLILLL